MHIRTEWQLVVFLSICLSVMGVVFFQLLEKFSFLSVSQVAEVCSSLAVSFSYSYFYHCGQTLAVVASGLITGLYLKALISFVKTQRHGAQLLSKKVSRMPIRLLRLSNQLGLENDELILINSSQPVAITVGIFNPRIVISTHLMTELTHKELEAVLIHEVHHLRRCHPLLFLAAEVVASSLPFVPIIKEIVGHFRYLMEYQADKRATKLQGSIVYISRALHKMTAGTTQYALFPAFSYTRQQSRLRAVSTQPHGLNLTLRSLLISAITVMSLSGLLVIPISVRAQQAGASTGLVNCSSHNADQCTTYCHPGVMSFYQLETSPNRSTDPLLSQPLTPAY
ncbi:MAG TPA: M56 family metallopeptidase [Vitreimonas sp.]|nr:M56 family metallopeptidase [Vitreimonas sp.]